MNRVPRAAGSAGGAAAAVLAEAALALADVAFDGCSADQALAARTADDSRRSAVRAVTLGALRWFWRLDALRHALAPGRPLSPHLHCLLLVALHQLEFSRNPPQAIVSSAVDATRLLRQFRAAGMVNALLRRFLREGELLRSQALTDAGVFHAHPPWLLRDLRKFWPQHWQQILQANNAHPPMTLRLDLARTTLERYRQLLLERGLEAHTYSWLPTALTLGQPLPVSDLPGFEDGWVSVQDAGAQLAAALLGLEAGQRVLDACAAPGGKTGALLESVGAAVELTAIDIDARRVALIGSNLRRLRRQARVVTADLRSELDWWDGIAFDRILLDAPCSATGVIRRHPDIKLLRRDSDIAALAEGQARLLEVTLGMLRSGGRLLYSTCSVLPAENEQLVQRVLERVARARVVELPAQVGLPADAQPRSIGIQLLPGNSALTDGFYYACLTVT